MTGTDVLGTITLPGECPTLFVGSRGGCSPGICLRWYWTATGGFDPEARGLLADAAVVEAFHDSVAIVQEVVGEAPGGLRLFPDDLALAQRRGIHLTGGSLGLALLLGALCLELGRPWPAGWVAWGVIQPARPNRFCFTPSSSTAAKALLAKSLGATSMLHPIIDRVPGPPYPQSIPVHDVDATSAARQFVAWLLGEAVP